MQRRWELDLAKAFALWGFCRLAYLEEADRILKEDMVGACFIFRCLRFDSGPQQS